MQCLFARQMKPLVLQQSRFHLFHGAAHGRFADAEAAGHMKLAAILTPVTQSQQKLVANTQSGRATTTAARRGHHLHHQLKHTPLNARQTIKLPLAIFAHFDESHAKKLYTIMQEVY